MQVTSEEFEVSVKKVKPHSKAKLVEDYRCCCMKYRIVLEYQFMTGELSDSIRVVANGIHVFLK